MDDFAVTKEMWLAWKQNPVTIHFLTSLNTKREEIKEALAEGGGGKEGLDIHIGRCMALKDTIQYALHEFDIIDREEETEDGN